MVVDGNAKVLPIQTVPKGAQYSFKQLLAEQVKYGGKNIVLSFVSQPIRKQLDTSQEGEKVKVKLSGDSARMSRVSNFNLLSLSILQSTDDLLSSKGRNMKKSHYGKRDTKKCKQ